MTQSSPGLPSQHCTFVLHRRGAIISNTRERYDDDILCPRKATRDVIVTFNRNAYVVGLCTEHGAVHDRAAADRRAQQAERNRQAAERATHNRRVAIARGQEYVNPADLKPDDFERSIDD